MMISRQARITRRVHFLTLVSICLWLISILLAPWLKSRVPLLGGLIYMAFAPTCHQVSERCFHLFGGPLAVCARCFGIYIGFLAGTLIFPFINARRERPLPSPRVFLALTIPIFLDTAANFFHVWNTLSLYRFALGILWGVMLPFYFIIGVSEFFIYYQKKG